jgi:hypothetical protein
MVYIKVKEFSFFIKMNELKINDILEELNFSCENSIYTDGVRKFIRCLNEFGKPVIVNIDIDIDCSQIENRFSMVMFGETTKEKINVDNTMDGVCFYDTNDVCVYLRDDENPLNIKKIKTNNIQLNLAVPVIKLSSVISNPRLSIKKITDNDDKIFSEYASKLVQDIERNENSVNKLYDNTNILNNKLRQTISRIIKDIKLLEDTYYNNEEYDIKRRLSYLIIQKYELLNEIGKITDYINKYENFINNVGENLYKMIDNIEDIKKLND